MFFRNPMDMCLNFAAFGFILEIDDLFTQTNFYKRLKDQYSLFPGPKVALRQYYEMGSFLVCVPDCCKPKNVTVLKVLGLVKLHIIVLGYCFLMANPQKLLEQVESWEWYGSSMVYNGFYDKFNEDWFKSKTALEDLELRGFANCLYMDKKSKKSRECAEVYLNSEHGGNKDWTLNGRLDRA